ncbi:HAMP domain-containing sensor histidine kinase [Cryobacterium sp. SO2]|uniref:sensor histidine kinase n=1 Tax=Cryobacterium sp. SO2 TaxID=1897060 RepID=UPI00223D9904|nr:HAMP domain-containing sensor histidine kinase [Cryobacterium sp. SO2]WEO77197.1 HAMP domain-containing sensor histidine kinase [Cryobacterium sp. SO2]
MTQQPEWPVPGVVESRQREVIVLHVPFLAAVLVLLGFVLAGAPATFFEVGFQVGLGLTVLATLMGLFVPWERHGYAWLVIVPLIDVIVVAFFRDGVRDVFPAVSLLLVLPVLWLAYGFAWWALGLAMVGAIFVGAFPLIQTGTWPTDAVGWGSALLTPIIITVIAITTRIAANSLRAQQRRLVVVSAELRAALLETTDRQALFEAVMETVDAGIELYSPQGEVVLSNAAARALALRTDSATGAYGRDASLVFDVDRTTLVALDDQIAARALRGDLVASRIYWVGGDDDQSAIMASAGVVERESGYPLGTVVVATDVTPLVEAIAVRDDFLATVSHELRTPLTSIIGYLGLIDAEALGITMEVAVIERNAERLLSVIAHLLSATDGQPPIHRVDADLGQILRSCLDTAMPRAQTAGVTISARDDALVRAEVDPVAIEQVIDNLLTNAIKFAREHGTVTLSVDQEGEDAVLRVTDDGIGLSLEDQRQVFDRFFRARNSTELAIPGMGLGLAIVRAFVKAHQGTVEVNSVLGEGTTFTVRLPLRAAGAVPAAEPPVSELVAAP